MWVSETDVEKPPDCAVGVPAHAVGGLLEHVSSDAIPGHPHSISMPYLEDLTLRLAIGIADLPEEVRTRHAAYLASMQQDDGGFAGRKGAGDLYYTSFALRALAMLGELDDPTAARTAEFIEPLLALPLSGIDFISLVISATVLETAAEIDVFADAGRNRKQTAIDFVDRFRRDDGGYAKTERGGRGSTYHTFLVMACKQMVEAPLEDTRQTVELIHARRRDDGGFVELDPMRRGGTNPTAAAIGLLRLLDALDEPTRTAAAKFLAGMQTAEGGLRANTQIPIADLLSTFTGLVALSDLDAAEMIDRKAARRFVMSLEQPAGGFRAGAWDDAVDVEYTFYGLGALALLTGGEG